ncbi:hypothetical protein [Actinoplanes sp. L3-i22]|uniref:hypothetical protein n=1 Tax=Actinoplanes sp. L3-i22 TaxID=2836373 RepID=UPI001C7680F5|nr:hypothetical protein [Actinoplanes sp. L3-i22]BCY09761.1 hypothetical protein L3i22_048490 [Actinoplanes sp. L3-i22]
MSPSALLLAGAAFLPLLFAGRAVVLPFLICAAVAALLPRLRRGADALVARVTGRRAVTPYTALADAARHLGAASIQEALPALERVLADGTGARRAAVWLAVGPRLQAGTDSAENLAVLLARPDVGHVVPVLDGTELRAVLSIEKPGLPVTPGDRDLMRDVANGAALLLRTVALNAVLAERVDRADHLARELAASRQRLAQAREVERRRLLTELARATSGRLVALREHVTTARADPRGPGLARARAEVDELVDRFRVIARGVYPAVLRGQGPGPALEELAADLRRGVHVSGDLGVRVAWELESAVYQVVAAALTVLADSPGAAIRVSLTSVDGRIRALVEDADPPVTAAQIRAALAHDTERLAALGGDLACDDAAEGLRLLARLPDRLDAEPAR